MKQVKDNIYLLESGKFANAYALVRDNGVLIIDTGTPGKTEGIVAELAEIKAKHCDIKAIIITHAHPDHAGSCAGLASKSFAKIYVHKNDVDIVLGKAPPPAPRDFVEKLSAFVTTHFMKYSPPAEAEPIDAHSIITGFEDIEIIETPGHTTGSISLLDKKSGTLFCGDAVNNRRNKLTGPLKYFTYDMDIAWDSVKKIASLEFDVLCPGHGVPIRSHAREKIKELLDSGK